MKRFLQLKLLALISFLSVWLLCERAILPSVRFPHLVECLARQTLAQPQVMQTDFPECHQALEQSWIHHWAQVLRAQLQKIKETKVSSSIYNDHEFCSNYSWRLEVKFRSDLEHPDMNFLTPRQELPLQFVFPIICYHLQAELLFGQIDQSYCCFRLYLQKQDT